LPVSQDASPSNGVPRPTSTISEQLARWSVGVVATDLPPDVADDIRWRLVDQVGVCIAGSRSASAGIIHRVAEKSGGTPESTSMVFGNRFPAPLAGWVNGAVGHGADYDDMHGVAAVHISSVAVPAALAAAEAVGATGAQCLVAMATGAEVALRINTGAPPHQFHHRGLHGTGVAGPFAAAAIAAKLMGLDEEATTNALGMAGSRSSGLMQTLIDGSWVKQLHPGWGVQGGITCAQLAAEGFTGPHEVIEGKFGFFNALLHGDEETFQFDQITDGLGVRWILPDTTYKPWPNGVWNHASMDGTMAILAREGLSTSDVDRIDCYVPPICIPLVCEPREAKLNPRSLYHMKFSLQYSVAMLAVLGSVEVDDYNETTLANQEIRDFAARVYCHADPSMPPDTFPARVRLTTVDGRVFEEDVPAQRGTRLNPMLPADHRRKFRGNVRPSLGDEQTDELLLALEGAWDAPDVRALMALTVPRTGAAGEVIAASKAAADGR
jgi:2-methylcitrate dehydratase PrpD